MVRYFETVSGVLESHGGTVEKFIGDAVMAVFGVPAVHEDDALRAVRSATEVQKAIEKLNAELEAERGVRIQIHTGVNSGEVFVGGDIDEHTLVTGDAVNQAARLQQAAGPGEILIGDATYRLARDAVVVEKVDSFRFQGKDDLVTAWRLVDVVEGAPSFSPAGSTHRSSVGLASSPTYASCSNGWSRSVRTAYSRSLARPESASPDSP